MSFEGCPGSRMMSFAREESGEAHNHQSVGLQRSELRQWPIQLHLVSPLAPYFQGADVVLTADCVAYAMGSYHQDYLRGNAIAVACPKLDDNQEVYLKKIKAWFDQAKINTLTVMIMQVPCCSGLLNLARQAAAEALRKAPVKCVVVSLQGEVLKEEWLGA